MTSYIKEVTLLFIDIINKYKIAADFGEQFGNGYEGFVRLNLATDPQNVKKAANSIVEQLKFI